MTTATAAIKFHGVPLTLSEEAALVAELKAGSEEAYTSLIAQYHQSIYCLVYRILRDPADTVETTQEVFLKVYRGMKRFNEAASLKTWIYRIAVHEALNQRRWWSRHKSREISMEPLAMADLTQDCALGLRDSLLRHNRSPFEEMLQEELRERIEAGLRNVQQPYRTVVILRDIEGLSYEETAQITNTSVGTVKSRLARGRQALRKQFGPLLQPLQSVLDRCRMSFTCGD